MSGRETETLQICNLATSTATLMKLPTIMYIHETFNLAETWVVNYKVQEGVNEKPLKMSQKISFYGPIFTISLEQNTNCQISDALLCIASLFKISNHFDHISADYVQKPTQKQLKWYFLLVRKLLKDENSRSTSQI